MWKKIIYYQWKLVLQSLYLLITSHLATKPECNVSWKQLILNFPFCMTICAWLWGCHWGRRCMYALVFVFVSVRLRLLYPRAIERANWIELQDEIHSSVFICMSMKVCCSGRDSGYRFPYIWIAKRWKKRGKRDLICRLLFFSFFFLEDWGIEGW